MRAWIVAGPIKYTIESGTDDVEKMQYTPLPANMELGPTLARRVHQLREFRNLTVKDLAKRVRFTVQRIEDIEAGLETWLSSTDRQMLAKGLHVEPNLLKDVEVRATETGSAESHMLNQSTADQIGHEILAGARDLKCPDCARPLKCSVQEGLDIEGRPIKLPKAYCLKCPFVLRF